MNGINNLETANKGGNLRYNSREEIMLKAAGALLFLYLLLSLGEGVIAEIVKSLFYEIKFSYETVYVSEFLISLEPLIETASLLLPYVLIILIALNFVAGRKRKLSGLLFIIMALCPIIKMGAIMFFRFYRSGAETFIEMLISGELEFLSLGEIVGIVFYSYMAIVFLSPRKLSSKTVKTLFTLLPVLFMLFRLNLKDEEGLGTTLYYLVSTFGATGGTTSFLFSLGEKLYICGLILASCAASSFEPNEKLQKIGVFGIAAILVGMIISIIFIPAFKWSYERFLWGESTFLYILVCIIGMIDTVLLLGGYFTAPLAFMHGKDDDNIGIIEAVKGCLPKEKTQVRYNTADNGNSDAEIVCNNEIHTEARQEEYNKASANIPFGDYSDAYIDLLKHILLSLFTFGIWYYIWIYRVTGYLNRVQGSEQYNPLNKLLLCIFVPFYGIYWFYKHGQKLETALKEKGQTGGDTATLCLILGIIMPIVACILMQDKINSLSGKQ